MGRRIDFLKEINESLSLIMDGTRQLVELTPKIKDKDLKTIIASAGKDYAKLNHRKSVKCPYPNCNGLVRKIKQDSEIFTKLEAVSNIYVCNANHNHRWENYKDI